MRTRIARWSLVAVAVGACSVLLAASPALAERPEYIPDTAGSTILMLPGTGDRDGADQIARTAHWFGNATVANGGIVVVDYPAAFGLRLAGVLIPFVGDATYNESTVVGTANLVSEAEDRLGQGQKVVLNGFSQSATPVMSAAYLLNQANPDLGGSLSVIVGADPRFPHTGVEVVMPSIIPGLYTNGERDPVGTGDIAVTSVCVIGDSTCGMANPLVRPISWAFYFIPGFYIHGSMYNESGSFTKVDEYQVGNTTFVVLDGGNPWGMMLRDLGIPVPREVDDVLNTLVPRQMPGQPTTLFGQAVPTPRAVQAALYQGLGLNMPVTDPDVVGTPGTVAKVGAPLGSWFRTPTVPTPAAPTPTTATATATAPVPAAPASAAAAALSGATAVTPASGPGTPQSTSSYPRRWSAPSWAGRPSPAPWSGTRAAPSGTPSDRSGGMRSGWASPSANPAAPLGAR